MKYWSKLEFGEYIYYIQKIKREEKHMIIIKYIVLGAILLGTSYIGILISKKYSNRVKDLKEMRKGLNFFEEKIKFTYEPIPDVFDEISKSLSENIGAIFYNSAKKMENISAGEAWENAVNASSNSFTKEDVDIIIGLAKMLGKTDIDGQVSEIRITDKFLDVQIKDAQREKAKNAKLYKTLGATVGLALVIVLI